LYAAWTERDAANVNQIRVAAYSDIDSAPFGAGAAVFPEPGMQVD